MLNIFSGALCGLCWLACGLCCVILALGALFLL